MLCNIALYLLIVPYGIETEPCYIIGIASITLLIVPYGIETLMIWLCFIHLILLIVPYGIETLDKHFDVISTVSF